MLLASLLLIAVTAPGLDNAADQPPAPGGQVSAPAPAPAPPGAAPAPAPAPVPGQPLRDSGWDAVIVLGAVVFAVVFSIFNCVRAGK